ncbi:hypothetical protein, partial [Pseudomonas sp. KBW05]|uniref:hypothetical protein n=1 Tax=Pseudomonas sp. KBW05 TaxID=2153360 RepID=UPI001C4986B0
AYQTKSALLGGLERLTERWAFFCCLEFTNGTQVLRRQAGTRHWEYPGQTEAESQRLPRGIYSLGVLINQQKS